MQTKRLNWLFIALVPVIMLFVGVLNSAETTHADNRMVVVPFVALAGDSGMIDSVAAPFIGSGDLKYVREYPNPGDYLHESPTPIPLPPIGPSLQIRMYQVTTDHVYVQDVLDAVVTATLPHNDVHPITGESLWLSYVPKQVVIHGLCNGTGSVASVFNTFDNDINQLQLINLDYVGLGGGTSECVGLYSIQTVKKVSELISTAGASATNARMEPNFLTGGTMGGYSTFGSPAAMLPGAPTTSTAGTSPISTTGNSVGVYIFDTSPYNNPNSIFNEVVKSKPIRVVHGGGIILPPTMPFRPATSVASHGTFVATPIVDWAPDSDISLVRALSQDAVGTEFALVQAVDWAIQDALTPGRDYNGVVFNYSLGLEDSVGDLQKTAVERMVNVMHTLGVVQVAAAGNDSAYETMPMPTNLPASNPNVMGVTALVPGNHIACYANQPRTTGRGFAARGGGAARGVAECDVDAFVTACAAGGSGCLHGWDPSSPTNFAYGIGTSFAAPHVAAFAAQIIEAKASAPRSQLLRATQSWITPADVATEIQMQATANGNDMGDGYITGYTAAPAAATLTEVAVSPQVAPLLVIFALVGLLSGTFVIRGYNRVHDES